MRVFVTGATGFVGSHVVNALTAAGHDVVALIRDRDKARRVFGDPLPEHVIGDLGANTSLQKGCDGADVVVHVAGIVAARSEEEFDSVNGEGTRQLTAVAGEVNRDPPRFLYVSSQAAAGPNPPGHPSREDLEPRPVSAYGRSKLSGERATTSSTLPWTIIRPAAVYGPRDTEFLKMFKMARWRVAPVFRGGRAQLSLVYGPDLADAIVSAMGDVAIERVLYTAHPEIWTQREVAVTIFRAVRNREDGHPAVVSIPAPLARAALAALGRTAQLTGRATLLTPDKAPEFLADAWTCDASAIEHTTGWRARTGLEEGLRRTASWYRKNGWL